jgi:ActR/RegA family two-component response regulator
MMKMMLGFESAARAAPYVKKQAAAARVTAARLKKERDRKGLVSSSEKRLGRLRWTRQRIAAFVAPGNANGVIRDLNRLKRLLFCDPGSRFARPDDIRWPSG